MHSDCDDDSELYDQRILLITDNDADTFGDLLRSLEEKMIDTGYERRT